VKVERLRQRGAEVVLTGEQPYRAYEEARDWGIRYMLERNHQLENLIGAKGAVRYIHGFEDVVPGQGVAGLEILEGIKNLPPLTEERLTRAAFLIPMGGGGLAAGVATAIRSRFPEARIFGIASDQAPALHYSLMTGIRSEVFLNEKSLCDSGIGLTIPGARPYAILREVLDGSLVVSDSLVGEAMRLIHRHHGTMVEGGGATGIAALLGGRLVEFGVEPSAPVVTILTGGNIDLSRHRGVMEGKEAPLPGGILDEILSPRPPSPSAIEPTG
jgi:threonine dehydratase